MGLVRKMKLAWRRRQGSKREGRGGRRGKWEWKVGEEGNRKGFYTALEVGPGRKDQDLWQQRKTRLMESDSIV